MRAVNANLTPAQVIARIESSASAFPQPAGLPVCPALATDGTEECACPNDGSQCGAGMVNALQAVNEALRPIAAVVVPGSTPTGSTAVLDASGSAASCGRTITAFAWAAGGGVTVQAGANSPQVTVTPTGSAGSLTLTVTDSSGATDTATLSVAAGGSITAPPTTPAKAGTSASACPSALSVTPLAPTVATAFSPTSAGENVAATLTITLGNSNGYALTQANLTYSLPANLTMATASAAQAPATTCAGGEAALASTTGGVSLSNANIPANGSCTITLAVQSAAAGVYSATVGAGALSTGPAGPNAAGASASLTVTAPSSHGGGRVDWWDTLFVVGVLLAGRRHGARGLHR